MATYPYTGSELNSKIQTGLSTQIVIKVGEATVGAIQTLGITHTRPIQRIGEVGTDGIIEAVPNQPTIYDITIKRIVFDKKNLPAAFNKGFVNIKSQLVPFDIEILDRSSDDSTDGTKSITTTLENCWFSKLAVSYEAGNYIISEDASVICEDIYSQLNGGNVVQTPFQDNTRERETDKGSGYRGTLDVGNIFEASFLVEEV